MVNQKSGLNMDVKHVNKLSLLLFLIYFILFYLLSVLHRIM
jgi:hypothetical protein